MSEDKDKLLATYAEKTLTLAKLEKATEVTKAQRSAVVKAVLDGHGKGPHEVDGKLCNVVAKGDTYYFLPVKTGADGTPKLGPSKEELDALVKAITGPMAASEVAKALGRSPDPKLSELLKAAIEQGLISKTGERAQTRYAPKA